MIVLRGWFPKPKSSKAKTEERSTSRYKFMGVFLTDAFTLTYRRVVLENLVISGETRFVGGLINMQEVYEVVDLTDEFNSFYVTEDVKTAIATMLSKLPRNVII